MTKQLVKLAVSPTDATYKDVVCTLSDKDVASLKATSEGVEVTAKKAGTASLQLNSYSGGAIQKVPVNVTETTTLAVNKTQAKGSMYVKDFPYENQIINGNMQDTSRIIYAIDDLCGYSRVNGGKIEYADTVHGKAILVDSTAGTSQASGVACVTPHKSVVSGQQKSIGVTIWAESAAYVGQVVEFRVANTSWGTQVTKSVTLTAEPQFVTITTPVINLPEAVLPRLYVALLNVGRKFYVKDFCMIDGTTPPTEYCPSPVDYGLPYGQCNLLNETSDQWTEVTFSNWRSKNMETLTFAELGLKAGDKLTLSAEIDATNSTMPVAVPYTITKSNASDDNTATSYVAAGSVGVSTASFTIADGDTGIIPGYVGKSDNTTSVKVKYRRHKMIKGATEAMDDWSPSYYDYDSTKGLPNKLKMWDFRSLTNLTEFNKNWMQPASAVAVSVDTTSKGLKFRTTTSGFSVNSRIYNETVNGGNHTVGNRTCTYYIDVTMPKDARIAIGTWENIALKQQYYTAPQAGRQIVKMVTTANFTALKVSIGFLTANVDYIIHRVKWIEGVNEDLGRNLLVNDWSLQAPGSNVENHMVPFRSDQYTKLASTDGIIRTETLQVGRGAEIQFDFQVLPEVVKALPGLFTSATTASAQLAILKSLLVSLRWSSLSRGYKFSRMDWFNYSANYWIDSKAGQNTTSGFVEKIYTGANLDTVMATRLLGNSGVYKAKLVADSSDGVSSSWVEVKDTKLEVKVLPPENPNAQPVTVTVFPS